MKSKSITLLGLSLVLLSCSSRWTTHVPPKVDPSAQYLFYLHGGVVQAQGLPAVSSYYGKYEYLDIVKELGKAGYHVISEARPKDTREKAYALKVSGQIDSLLRAGVPVQNITVVGASLGAYITMDLALHRKQTDLKYALLGLCSDYALSLYQDRKNQLTGRFLSIYEASDSKGSCASLFTEPGRDFKEIRLEMGNDHAFLFKPFKEWVKPLAAWIEEGN